MPDKEQTSKLNFCGRGKIGCVGTTQSEFPSHLCPVIERMDKRMSTTHAPDHPCTCCKYCTSQCGRAADF
jgi:hypothetical protein